MKSEFNANNIECDFVDYFHILDDKLSKKIENLYLKAVSGNGKIFRDVYKLGEIYNKVNLKSPVYELNKLARHKVAEFITENHYFQLWRLRH